MNVRNGTKYIRIIDKILRKPSKLKKTSSNFKNLILLYKYSVMAEYILKIIHANKGFFVWFSIYNDDEIKDKNENIHK